MLFEKAISQVETLLISLYVIRTAGLVLQLDLFAVLD